VSAPVGRGHDGTWQLAAPSAATSGWFLPGVRSKTLASIGSARRTRSPRGASSLHQLVTHDAALDLVRAVRPVVAQIRKPGPRGADEVVRAASSTVLDLAEGGRRHGRDPRRFWDMARRIAGRSALSPGTHRP
jgi:hypothetical protein